MTTTGCARARALFPYTALCLHVPEPELYSHSMWSFVRREHMGDNNRMSLRSYPHLTRRGKAVPKGGGRGGEGGEEEEEEEEGLFKGKR